MPTKSVSQKVQVAVARRHEARELGCGAAVRVQTAMLVVVARLCGVSRAGRAERGGGAAGEDGRERQEQHQVAFAEAGHRTTLPEAD